MEPFTITSAAAERIAVLQKLEADPTLKLRITVNGGGCSGFRYEYKLEKAIEAHDLLFSYNGMEVVIDDISMNYLQGAVLDYVEDLGSAGFEIKNPQAKAGCGCGASFSI